MSDELQHRDLMGRHVRVHPNRKLGEVPDELARFLRERSGDQGVIHSLRIFNGQLLAGVLWDSDERLTELQISLLQVLPKDAKERAMRGKYSRPGKRPGTGHPIWQNPMKK